jgi:hypothetical protein
VPAPAEDYLLTPKAQQLQAVRGPQQADQQHAARHAYAAQQMQYYQSMLEYNRSHQSPHPPFHHGQPYGGARPFHGQPHYPPAAAAGSGHHHPYYPYYQPHSPPAMQHVPPLHAHSQPLRDPARSIAINLNKRITAATSAQVGPAAQHLLRPRLASRGPLQPAQLPFIL